MKVKIGPLTYDLLLVPKLASDEGIGLSGQILYEEGVIKLEKESNPRRQLVVLWHEVMHGISDLYGLELSEQTVSLLATATFCAFEENPILMNGELTTEEG